jgi:hypothetical protein
MPLGTPEGPTASTWKITANSIDPIGEYLVTFAIAATTDNPDDPKMPLVVQKFIDLVHASPDFRFISATRSYSYTEPITPTV